MVEQLPCKQEVVGSIPTAGTKGDDLKKKKKEAKFKWHGIRPVDNGELEEKCREEMRKFGCNMRKPRNLLFHTVVLTPDYNGSGVSITGGRKRFHAEYFPKLKWSSWHGEDGGDAA